MKNYYEPILDNSGQEIPQHCYNCSWYGRYDHTTGIEEGCECDKWEDTITDEQIEQHRKTDGIQCPEYTLEEVY